MEINNFVAGVVWKLNLSSPLEDGVKRGSERNI